MNEDVTVFDFVEIYKPEVSKSKPGIRKIKKALRNCLEDLFSIEYL
jgi:hypothetical protein